MGERDQPLGEREKALLIAKVEHLIATNKTVSDYLKTASKSEWLTLYTGELLYLENAIGDIYYNMDKQEDPLGYVRKRLQSLVLCDDPEHPSNKLAARYNSR